MMIDPSGHKSEPYYLNHVWYDIYGHARMDNPRHPNFVYDCDPYYKEQSLIRGGAKRGTPRTVRSPEERVSVKYPEEVKKGENLRKSMRNGLVIGAIGGAAKSKQISGAVIGGITGVLSPFVNYMINNIIRRY